MGEDGDGGEGSEEADGDVDVEDEPPVHVLDEPAAERGPDRRRDHDAETVEAHRRADALARHQPVDDRLAEHREQAAADRLDDAEDDEGVEVPGDPAERGAGDEGEQRRDVERPQPEAVAQPPARGHDDAEGEAVPRGDPLHLVGAGAEVRLDPRGGDVDDARVEQCHEGADHHHEERDQPPAGGGGRDGPQGRRARRGGRRPARSRDRAVDGGPRVHRAPGRPGRAARAAEGHRGRRRVVERGRGARDREQRGPRVPLARPPPRAHRAVPCRPPSRRREFTQNSCALQLYSQH